MSFYQLVLAALCVGQADSMHEQRRDIRRQGRRLRRCKSLWQPRAFLTSKQGRVNQYDGLNQGCSDASEVLSENDMQEDQNKLMETMVMNSKLEDANVRFEYQIEDYKDKIADLEDLLGSQRAALQRKSKEVMEAQYEIRLLSEKVAVMNEVDGGPKKNLIMCGGKPSVNLVLHETDSHSQELPSPGDSIVLEQLSRLNNEMQNALNQCEALESEMTSLMDENLVLRRERDAAVELTRSLLSQVRTAESEKAKSVMVIESQAKELEDVKEERKKLKQELADKALMATDDDAEYTDDDLDDACGSLSEDDENHTLTDQQKSVVEAEEVAEHTVDQISENIVSGEQLNNVSEDVDPVYKRRTVRLESVDEEEEETVIEEDNKLVALATDASALEAAADNTHLNGFVTSELRENISPALVNDIHRVEGSCTDEDSMRTSDLPIMSMSSTSTFSTSANESIARQWDVISVRHPAVARSQATLRRTSSAPIEWVGPLPSNLTLRKLREMKKSMSTVQYCLAKAFVTFSALFGIHLQPSLEDDIEIVQEPSRCAISEASLNIRWTSEKSSRAGVVLSRVVKDIATNHAGSMSSDDSFIVVSWPNVTVEPSITHLIHYEAVQGEDVLSLEEGEVLLSPIVYVSSDQREFKQSLRVEVPHCALIDSGGWNITLLQNNRLLSQKPEWKSLAMWRWPCVGSNEKNDCHLGSELFQVDTRHASAFALIGRAAIVGGCVEVPLKRVSLAVFYSVRSYRKNRDTKIVHLVVACTPDISEFQKGVELIQSEDYYYICSPWTPLVVSGNGSDLIVKLVGSAVNYSFIGDKEKVVPFDNFWFGSTASFASLTLAVEQSILEEMPVNLLVGQIGKVGEHDEQQIHATVGLHRDDALPYRSHVTSVWRIVLPYNVADKLAQLLDPEEPRGNDWRHVAHVLGLDAAERREMERLAYPTHYILSRLPSLDDNRNTLQGLFDALFRTERSDAVEVITDWLSDM